MKSIRVNKKTKKERNAESQEISREELERAGKKPPLLKRIDDVFPVKYILAIIGSLIALAAIIFIINVNVYYRPSGAARDAMKSTASVEVKDHGDYVTFISTAVRSEKGLIFYPEKRVDYRAYAPLMQKLAEKGVLCALLKMPFHSVYTAPDRARGITYKYEDVNMWYTGGHGKGSRQAEKFIMDNKQEFKGMLYLGAFPKKDMSDTEFNSITIYGTKDNIMGTGKYKKNSRKFSKAKDEDEIKGGNHSNFCFTRKSLKGDGKASVSQTDQTDEAADFIFINM